MNNQEKENEPKIVIDGCKVVAVNCQNGASCGASTTISPGAFPVNFVMPPSPVPPYSSGAFVQFTMPSGQNLSVIRQLVPVWYK